MRRYERLRAFQHADELAVKTYQATRDFPMEERFGLTSQLRRGAVSVPSNIVEGCARHSEADYLRFLDIALGSLKELQYQWRLAHRLGFTTEENFKGLDELADETARTLTGLIKKVRRRVQNS